MTAEEYIKDFTRGCSNELDDGEYEYWLTPWQAETACNLAREEVRKQFEKEQLKHHDELTTNQTHKEVDLENEIKNEIDNLSNLYCYMEDLFSGKEEEGVYPIPEKVKNELFEFAKHFFELGLNTNKVE